MTLTKTIQYNTEGLVQDLQNFVQIFLDKIKIDKISNSLGHDLTQKILAGGNLFLKRLKGNFSLVVIGDFKRGKSTLINALVGQEVVITNVTPETVTINYVEYGSESKIEAIFKDGGKVNLKSDELYSDKLQPLLAELPPLQHIKIYTPVEWLKGISLIDTPGTGDIFEKFDRDVHSILERADAVIFTISALSPLSISEQNFLKLSLLPQDFPKVFFALNMLDIARSPEDARRLLNSVQTKIDLLFPKAQLFGISAKNEYSRIDSLSRSESDFTLFLDQAFEHFRDSLENFILLDRDLIQLDRLTTQLERNLINWRSQINLLIKAIESNQMELSQAITQCQDRSSELFARIRLHKQQMNQEVESLSKQAVKWLNEFLDRLEIETIDSLDHHQFPDVRRHYHFFLADSIQKAVSSCLEVHRSEIFASWSKAASSIVEELNHLKDFAPETSQLAAISIDQQQWTNLDTFQTILQITPFAAISNILIDQLKKSTSNSQIKDYQRHLQKSFPRIRVSLVEQIESIYPAIIRELEVQLDKIYEQEIDASLSALEQAKKLSALAEEDISTSHDNLKIALSLLSDMQNNLNNVRQKLWNNSSF